MTPLAPYLRYWRTTVARDREIVEGVVEPDHRGPSPELARALDEWPGLHYWTTDGDGDRLVLIRALSPRQRERWWLHALLFGVTFLTAWMGGTLLAGLPTGDLPHLRHGDVVFQVLAAWAHPSIAGLPFAMALMAILLAHEMGHYLTAKRYGINASPPYFLPAPVGLNFIGTFGAFIRLRSPVVDRRQLIDVGAAGPWVGFLVALLMLIVGLQQASPIPGGHEGFVIYLPGHTFPLGDSLLTMFARHVFVGRGTVVLGPLAMAGWVGLLVTTLNLLPLGQLDGGHVLYALLGERQRVVGHVVWIGLVILGVKIWGWWLAWAFLTVLLGGGRVAHPQVLEPRRPLPGSRWPFGLASILLFAVTFVPVPFNV